jgi:hypothetical protein|tara:strand:- start:2441 stop:3022 length:582 start_codon:yes stop_codon:yes gene_type:complete
MYGKEYGQPNEAQDMAPPPAQEQQMAAPPEEDIDAQLDELARSAPEPTKPFSAKAIQSLVDIINDSLSKISDVEIPEISFDDSGVDGGKLNSPLPADIFLTLVAISQLITMVGGGEFSGKFGFDPFTLVTDTDLRKAAAQIKMMAKDKKFIEAVSNLQGEQQMPGDEGPQDAGMAPPPSDMTDEDAMLASEMK